MKKKLIIQIVIFTISLIIYLIIFLVISIFTLDIHTQGTNCELVSEGSNSFVICAQNSTYLAGIKLPTTINFDPYYDPLKIHLFVATIPTIISAISTTILITKWYSKKHVALVDKQSS
jgi:hypothetical protein